MKIEVVRYSSSPESTLGLLFIDGGFECYTLEDEFREKKVWGDTRIPAGTYAVKLRKYGGHHEKYLKKYGSDFHHGMLQVMDVKGFNDILIHKGNTDNDTAGCLLVGDGVNNNQTRDGFISASGEAYERIYPKIAAELLLGQKVYIQYRDQLDKPPLEDDGTLRKVGTERLYMREAPHGPKKAILFGEGELEVLLALDNWSKVKLEGWVDSKYIR